MQFLFRLAQKSKPQVSTEQYGALLRAAWEAGHEPPPPPDLYSRLYHPSHDYGALLRPLWIDPPFLGGVPMQLYRPVDDENPDALRREYLQYAQEGAHAFDQLNARRLELEAVRPDSQLSRVHEEAVKSFRGLLELRNARAKRDIAMVEGNFAAAQKADNEVHHWWVICDRVDRKLAAALRQVQLNQPALFAALDLPEFEIELIDLLLERDE
jgi:hypothetical protein